MKFNEIESLSNLLFSEGQINTDELRKTYDENGPLHAIYRIFRHKAFRKKYKNLFSNIPHAYQRLNVEYHADSRELAELFGKVQKLWTELGRNDPHWSVLSYDDYRQSQVGKNLQKFEQSGRLEVKSLEGLLKQLAPDLQIQRAVEYGCGVGRVSIPLSKIAGELHCYDISLKHLELAKARAEHEGVNNISFHHVTDPDLQLEDKLDLFYSVIVLQHNPPPLISHILNHALEQLRSGGVAVFQAVVFRKNYHFNLGEYLRESESEQIEMHAFPQHAIFELLEKNDCRILDVTDFSPNMRHSLISNIFTVRKR